MVQTPSVRVCIGPRQSVRSSGCADASVDPSIEARVQATTEHALQVLARQLPVDWTVVAARYPRLHSGLGLGTQLAAAVAAAVQLACIATTSSGELEPAASAWRSFASTDLRGDDSLGDLASSGVASGGLISQSDLVRELSRVSGRGKRSAVGLHGFLFGGLVQDLGQSASRQAEPEAARSNWPARGFGTLSCAFPDTWPIVLVLSTQGGDMCGATEDQLIGRAGAAPNVQRAAMLELCEAAMAAARASDFKGFVSSLEEYMLIAATLFAPVQAGRYRDEQIASRVELAQRAGLRGVGQSSWGPTVFGFAASAATAQQAADQLRSQLNNQSAEVLITQAANQGASWRQIATGVPHAS